MTLPLEIVAEIPIRITTAHSLEEADQAPADGKHSRIDGAAVLMVRKNSNA